MHSRITTAVVTVTALMLSACTSESETKLEPGQKAFVFESGVVPIGDFDPWAFEIDELFDPCNEISDEEFARAGFTGKKLSSTKGEIESPHGNSICTFSDEDDNEAISVLNSGANKNTAKQLRVVNDQIGSEILPEIYVYRQELENVFWNPCIAQIDTNQGAIAVIFSTIDKHYSFDELCTIAIEKIENLYKLQHD